MKKNVINLGILSDISLLEANIPDRYYIYYKADGDLYMYNSFKDKEINLFKLGNVANGILSLDFNKLDNGLLSLDFTKVVDGNLVFNFNKYLSGKLSLDFNKTSNGTLSLNFTKNDRGILNVYIKEFT